MTGFEKQHLFGKECEVEEEVAEKIYGIRVVRKIADCYRGGVILSWSLEGGWG